MPIALDQDVIVTPAMRHRALMHAVCERHGVTFAAMLGKKRTPALVLARRECALLLTNEFKLSSVQAGKIMNRHHTTILHLMERTSVAQYQGRRRAQRDIIKERKMTASAREILPTRRSHELLDFEYAHSGHTLGVGYFDFEQTRVAEIFIDSHKTGSALAANARDGAVVASIALQHGASLGAIHSALNREPYGPEEADGKAAGVVGAALDRLLIERPELFAPVVYAEEAPAATEQKPDTAATLKRIADILGRPVESFFEKELPVFTDDFWGHKAEIEMLRSQNADLIVVAENLRQENHDLHQQVANQADQMTSIVGSPIIVNDKLSSEQLERLTEYLKRENPLLMVPMEMPSQFGFEADLNILSTRRFRQSRTTRLAADIWGDEAVFDKGERLRRFWEEACELVQALGMPMQQQNRIFREVDSREPGEPEQEIGGVYFTMLCLCAVHRWSAEELEIREIRRVMAKDPNVMRARHQQKVEAGVAMQARRPEIKQLLIDEVDKFE